MFTVFIAADIEGITGYVDWPEKPPEELWFREQMTAEVNASIEGALDAGADKIISNNFGISISAVIFTFLSSIAKSAQENVISSFGFFCSACAICL